MTEYTEHFISTFTGKKFHYLDPKPEEIDIIDIAHHLSLLCRFTGACKRFYSVAEHSVRMVETIAEEYKLQALLHDAAEAYIGDISRPIKVTYKLYETEKVIEQAIANKYGIVLPHPEVKKVDDILIATEARDLMDNMTSWKKLPPPLAGHIPVTTYMNPVYWEREFLSLYEFLK